MKKRVLFIMPSMFIGGAERSLIGLLDSMDYNAYDVDLFLYRHEGEFLTFIPNRVNILPAIEEYSTFDVPIKELLLSKKWVFGILRAYSKFKYLVNRRRKKLGVWAAMQYISRSLIPILPEIPGEYDVAISFLGIPDVLVKKVHSKKKIAWNHTDYTILGPDLEYDQIVYKNIDHIISVSESCTNQFTRVYPQFANKVLTIENLISADFLMRQSQEEVQDFEYDDGCLKILSIGRFSEAKNFDNVPDICKRIRESGLNVKWYLIGYGTDEVLIRKKIAESNMDKYVIILGKRINPYPYLKKCDIYIQPSRYEGKCVSVIEAQILHKPVIITNYATSSNQLVDGIDGIIVPLDNSKCAEGIIQFIRNHTIQQKVIENTKNTDYSNKTELEKLYNLF